MSARGFGPVLWAGAVAGAALGFYLVSLNVASERAELEDVETRIALAQRDIRLLQTEIGTRGRLAQLERWNVKFIRLSAPTADQFIEGGFHLARLVTPQKRPVIEAPVVLASAPVDQSVVQQPSLGGDDAGAEAGRQRPDEMLHVASFSVPSQPVASRSQPAAKPGDNNGVSAARPRGDHATKSPKSAMTDPLAPLPGARAGAKGGAPAPSAAGAASQKPALKDRVTD